MITQVAVLYANQLAFDVEVGYLEPRDAMAVGEGGEAAPADDLFIELALAEEECTGRLVERWMLEEAAVTCGIEGLRIGWLVGWLPLGEDHVVLVGKPLAGFDERLTEHVHGQVDDSSMAVAHEALVGVAAGAELQAGVAVRVKWAKALVTANLEPQPLSHSLDWEGSEFLNVESIHKVSSFRRFQVSIILDEHFHLRIGLIDHLGLFPLGNEDAVGR